MAFDNVPWMVGGGAEHSPEVVRTNAYASTNGAEGVVSVGDLKVVPLDVPGTAVRVLPGGGLALNRHPGHVGETYTFRNASATQVDVASTGSGGGRVDLIVVRVEDPFLQGSPYDPPADVKVGPYVFARVVSNVPAGTTRLQDVPGHEADTGVALARIDIPASTGTITAGMITDLRKVAIPRTMSAIRTYALVGEDTETLTATGEGGEIWPNAAESAWQAVDIPEWATRVRVVATWAGVQLPSGNASGTVWLQLGAQSGGDFIATQTGGWNGPNTSDAKRQVFMIADDRAVPASMRGTARGIYPRARLLGSSGSGARPVLDWASSMVVQLEFYEQAV